MSGPEVLVLSLSMASGDLKHPCSKLRLRVEREAGEAHLGPHKEHLRFPADPLPLPVHQPCHSISPKREEGEEASQAQPAKLSSPERIYLLSETMVELAQP